MVYALSDFHLSFSGEKPMDVFGDNWQNHWQKIVANTNSLVTDDDILLIAGDLCWAMKLSSAKDELAALSVLNGKKVLVKGNHDYWWSSLSQAQALVGADTALIQCNALRIDNYVFVGSRGWEICLNEEDSQNLKLYKRELIRLEQSLLTMKRIIKEGDEVIGMMHFPPFQMPNKPSGFTKLFTDYGVKKVVYGHLHSKEAKKMPPIVTIEQTQYFLTSCDAIDFKPIKIS